MDMGDHYPDRIGVSTRCVAPGVSVPVRRGSSLSTGASVHWQLEATVEALGDVESLCCVLSECRADQW